MDEGLLRELQDAIGDAYAIERELGRGREVARPPRRGERSLGRRVVIKVLPPELVSGVSEARLQRAIIAATNLYEGVPSERFDLGSAEEVSSIPAAVGYSQDQLTPHVAY